MEFLEDKQAQAARLKLEEDMRLDPVVDHKEFSSDRVNWVEGERFPSWEDTKAYAKDVMNQEDHKRPIFLAHSRDTIEGKPQLVHSTMKTIVLMKHIIKPIKDSKGELEGHSIQWKFLDEHYDKRYDGNLKYEWSQDFWIYKITHESKDYYIFSYEELEMKNYTFEGMIVQLNDRTEMNNNLRLKSISRVFFLKSFEPTVKPLPKERIVELTKKHELTKEIWFQLLNYHPLGTINNFPEDVNLLRTAQMLSGKYDGWPLHLCVMGRAGTRKSFGYIETTAFKFDEDAEIVEGANSRIKGLSPSFKEKPANIGYLARAERMGFIDELGKMVEFEINKHQGGVTNVLGELNFLYDHKKRTVGSGNDNDCVVQANAKFLHATNGVKGKKTIGDHVGLIDPTTMSRILWWVQDDEEVDLVLSDKGIVRIPPTHTQAIETKKNKRAYMLSLVLGGIFKEYSLSRDIFLILYDSCNNFIISLGEKDREKLDKIVKMSINLSKEPMKSVWRSRSEHHTFLILDGLVKFRCLFEDYDDSFDVKDVDFERLERIIIRMVKSWDCPVSINNKFGGF